MTSVEDFSMISYAKSINEAPPPEDSSAMKMDPNAAPLE
jgi:hypothetical protein